MKEEWKDIFYEHNGEIIDYRGLYQVSNFGRVKALNFNRTGKEQILATGNIRNYLTVSLRKNGKQKIFQVHRLVAHMFLSDTYFENAQVDHINTIPYDNHVDNLRWCTPKENMNNLITQKRKKGETLDEETEEILIEIMRRNNQSYQLDWLPYYKYDRYDLDMNYIDMGMCKKEYKDFDSLMVFLCANGEIETYGGYIWRKHGSYKGRKN